MQSRSGRSSWRAVYVWSVVLASVFSVLQLLLIFQINRTVFHVSNFVFALGDDVITAYIAGQWGLRTQLEEIRPVA
jgi:hypothetical protein